MEKLIDDAVPAQLDGEQEANCCERLAAIIEDYGLETVQYALNQIRDAQVWTRPE